MQVLGGDEYFTYSYVPKVVHPNQIFSVTIDQKKYFETKGMTFKFEEAGVKPLFKYPLKSTNSRHLFYYTFFFKAGRSDIKTAKIEITSYPDPSFYLPPLNIPLKPLSRPPKNFCKVLASGLKIDAHQISIFDTTQRLLTLNIEATEANLEDMVDKNATQQGVENIQTDYAKKYAEFFVVLPKDQKRWCASYYNTIKQKFEEFCVDTTLLDSTVVGQSDLNPNEDAFLKLKRYLMIVLSAIFILLFVWKRDLLFLLLAVASVAVLILFYLPEQKICIKQGAALFILPTKSSEIGLRVDKKQSVTLLGKRDNYNKVELQNGTIGWIKDVDVCKD